MDRANPYDEIRIPWDFYRMPKERLVRLGEDSNFPKVMVASAESHLRWAHTLVDCGLFEQAQQQLALLPQTHASGPLASWLRARLGMVALRTHLRWAYTFGEHYGLGLTEPGGDAAVDAVNGLLERAMAGEPDNGGVWLTSAQFFLSVAYPRNPARAVECARRAHELLGDEPEVLLTLGRAARAVDSYAEAAAALRAVPDDAEAARELALADLEVTVEAEPPDPDACLRLGRHYLRLEDWDRAAALFGRLHRRLSHRAEGYYGLGYLEFFHPERRWAINAEKAHEWCQVALARDEHLGPAHELLGLIYGVDRSLLDNPTYAIGDRIECFRRSLELDPTCWHALRFLAEEHLDRGELDVAVQLLEQAVELDTRSDWVYRVLAVVYEGKRQFSRSEEMAERAQELKPNLVLTAEYKQRILDLCGFAY